MTSVLPYVQACIASVLAFVVVLFHILLNACRIGGSTEETPALQGRNCGMNSYRVGVQLSQGSITSLSRTCARLLTDLRCVCALNGRGRGLNLFSCSFENLQMLFNLTS